MFRLFTLFLGLCAVAWLAQAKHHRVTVGGPGVLAYDPEFVVADPGDTIYFVFKQKNHTLTQSTFADPCTPVSGGFDSGFHAVDANNTEGPFPGAEITVVNTDPTWAFCRQATHCRESGMVFAINPGKKFEAFKANALGNIDTSSSNPASTTTRGSSTVTSMSTTTHAASATPFTTQSTMFTLSLLPSFTLDTPTGSVPDSATTFSVGSILPSSASAAPSAVPTDMSTDHWVIVGANSQLMFTPSNITAHIGDTITFELRPKNHSVTASSFAQPCTPLSQTNASASGAFNSGFLPMDAGTTNFPTYTIQVNSTNPIWVFSGQPAECAAGMVFSANAPADASFPAFQENAQATNATLPAMNGARAGARHMSSLALAAVPLLLSAFLA